MFLTRAKYIYTNNYYTNSLKINELILALKQAIHLSEKISGKFYRSLPSCKNEDEVAKLMFNNKGFTSTAPEINKNYAESFAIGKSGALVEFDLKIQIKGYKANSYEVLFDTKAFTPERYEMKKINDRLYRVTERQML